jgi:hypothetical protein
MAYTAPDPRDCTHALYWGRYADTGALFCADCGSTLTISKPHATAGAYPERLQHSDVQLRAADGSVLPAGAEADPGAGEADCKSGAGAMRGKL